MIDSIVLLCVMSLIQGLEVLGLLFVVFYSALGQMIL